MDAGTETGRTPGGVRSQVMAQAAQVAGVLPRPQPVAGLCPYCGSAAASGGRCAVCGGRTDPLSRQATQNHMGPWSVRDDRSPHRPGCTYDTLCRMIDAGTIGPDTVLRGPSTRQFWAFARDTPGVAHRLGLCHNCHAPVEKNAFQCPACHAAFTVDRDRQHLGVGPTRPLPGQAAPEVIAAHAGPAPVAGIEASKPHPASEDDPMTLARQAQAAAAGWRRASETERARGLVALVLASLVVLTSLLYAGMVAQDAAESDPEELSSVRAG